MSASGKFWTASHTQAFGCSPCDATCSDCWAAQIVDNMGRNSKVAALLSAENGLTEGHLLARPRFTGKVLVRADHVALSRVLAKRRPQVLAVNWLGDLGYEGVPEGAVNDLLGALLAHAIDRNARGLPPWVYLFLTHRPSGFASRARAWLAPFTVDGHATDETNSFALRSFWWGATVTHQSALAPALELGALPGHHWICAEPMVGPLILGCRPSPQAIEWIVTGWYSTREGGAEFRASWLPSLRVECDRAGIPIWAKATGERHPRNLPREMPDVVRVAFEGGMKTTS